MAAAAVIPTRSALSAAPAQNDTRLAAPLYLASAMVTLAGLGAVGVTISLEGWMPIWVLLSLAGHLVSYALRARGLSQESVFWPVMVLGSAVALQMAVMGNPLSGVHDGIGSLPVDMATATVVGILSSVRTFTLLNNGALLFSPVPAITMLALVGSSNPNAEVPVFYGLLILGSLFITGYEANLRRAARSGRAAAPVFPFLVTAWVVTLALALVALVFPLLLQPLIGPFSPFALPAVNRLQTLMNFTQSRSNISPVGAGPIRLSENPVYEMHAPEAGLVRTRVFTEYTGSSWESRRERSVDLRSDTRELRDGAPRRTISRFRHHFAIPQGPGYPAGVAVRRVQQRYVALDTAPDGIPGLGRIVDLKYPASMVYLHSTGVVTGSSAQYRGTQIEVVSEVPEIPPAVLQAAPAIDPAEFQEPETLRVPPNAQPLRSLAQEITAGATNNYDRVRALMAYINEKTTYTLDAERTPEGEDATVHYLFRTRRGACDLAASALVMLCRSLNIPARAAVGYLVDEPLPEGEGFLVRQSDAHMWAEVYFPGVGWVDFNPAPPLGEIRENPLVVLWNRLRSLVSRIGGGGLDAWLLIAVTLGTLGAGVYQGARALQRTLARRAALVRQVEASPAAALAVLYNETLCVLERRGWARETWMTPREYRDGLRSEWRDMPDLVAALDSLTETFERGYFAGDLDDATLQQARTAATFLRRTAPKRPKTVATAAAATAAV